MADNGSQEAIGFLSVLNRTECGYFGGLLLVNCLGRPLEFHCTLPVKPTRAQEILYGPTLPAFISGELIGLALVNKLKSDCPVIFTDVRDVLSLRQLISTPIVLIANETKSVYESNALESFEIEDIPAAVSSAFTNDVNQVLKLWKSLSPNIHLQEPFGRIHEALMEANPTAKAA